MRRLRGGDVDAVGERSDDETAGVAEVLERVLEGRVADVVPNVLGRGVAALLEVSLELAHPLEAIGGVELVFDEVDDNVARVRLHRDEVHRLATHVLLEAGVLHEHDQVEHHLLLDLVVLLHRLTVAGLHLLEGRLHVARPRPLGDDDAQLANMVVQPVGAQEVARLHEPREARALDTSLLVLLDASLRLCEHLVAHLVDHGLHVDLDLARECERAGELALEHLGLVGLEAHDLILGLALELDRLDTLQDVVDMLDHDPRPVAVGQDVEQIVGREEVCAARFRSTDLGVSQQARQGRKEGWDEPGVGGSRPADVQKRGNWRRFPSRKSARSFSHSSSSPPRLSRTFCWLGSCTAFTAFLIL